MKPRQRAVIVEKLPDLANLIAGVFVVGVVVLMDWWGGRRARQSEAPRP